MLITAVGNFEIYNSYNKYILLEINDSKLTIVDYYYCKKFIIDFNDIRFIRIKNANLIVIAFYDYSDGIGIKGTRYAFLEFKYTADAEKVLNWLIKEINL